MHIRIRMLAAGILVAASGVVALTTASSPAQAAPVSVPGCAGDTGGVSVTVDDAAFAGGAMVPIHDNTAGVRYPAPTDAAMSAPLCGARRLADGTFQREWVYCTNAELNTCGTGPMLRKGNAATGVSSLTPLDRAHLAWLMPQLKDATVAQRLASQRLVWCVTENGYGPGDTAPLYAKDGSDDPNVKCPVWPAAADLKLTALVTLTGPAAPTAVGGTARFTLTTNSSPIALTATGMTGLALCPGVTGATLAGGTLTMAAPDPATPVALCATAGAAGTGTLKAAVAERLGATLEFWQRNADTAFCQGMLSTQTLSTDAVSATASATFAADATTTTSTTVAATTTTANVSVTTAASSTTTSIVLDGGNTTTTVNVLDTAVPSPGATLPRTGSGSQDGAFWALALLLGGVCLAALGRRSPAD